MPLGPTPTPSLPANMAAPATMDDHQELANRVMRRVQVSKMTRALQDRLALANVKIQNGWENMSLEAIEPQVEERLRRKRPASSNNDTISDTASTTSSRLHSSHGLASSPITDPMFSDDFARSGGSFRNKRAKPSDTSKFPSFGAVTGRRTGGAAARQNTWKKNHSLPASSPIKHTKHARLPSNQASHLSFISEGSTVADDPPSPEFSEEDDADLPVSSFNVNHSTRIASSPPRTPPPDRRMRKAHLHQVSWSRTPKTNDDGADLLMYLATSPSPANGTTKTRTAIQPPSTPPAKATPLPSSHMTPGMTDNGFLGGFGPNTPNTSFNFADFVNVTPSPAQGPWTRTPIAGRTPAASARRKLDFENMTFMPPMTSPNMSRNNRREGLGMDLGGKLLS